MEYKMTMHLKHNCYPTDHVMSQEEIDVMFGGRNWESWQNQMIRLIVENKAAFTVWNEEGQEVFYCTYTDSKECPEHICYGYSDEDRLERFMNYINTKNV